MTIELAPLADLRPDPEESAPLYLQLAKRLTDAIRNGRWKAGDALPSERQMCEVLGVSRVTLRKALDTLAADGLVEARHGSGTFVADRVHQPMSVLTSFSYDMESRGQTPSSRWLKHGYFPATPEEAMALGLAPGEPIFRLHRLRLADGEPMAIEIAVLNRSDVPDPESIGPSLYAYLATRGREPTRALEHLRATILRGEEAAILSVPKNSAALYITRVGYLPDGRVVEFTRSYYRGDRYDFVAELHRQPESARHTG
ncbi:MAG: GntR family transcriptional regulator [Pseudomonadota bacterium]